MSVTKRGTVLGLLILVTAGAGVVGGCCSLGLKSCQATDLLTFSGDEKLNSCSGDQYSYPVAVRLYYLNQDEPFRSAEFQELWEDDGGAMLRDTRLGPPINLTVTPGGETPSSTKRPDGATHLGLLANFCRLDGGTWRWVIPLDKGVRATVRLKDVQLFVESGD